MPDYEQPYWSEWSDRIITRYNMKRVSGGNSSAEYHGPCPSCGGTDRFRINEYQNLVKVHCRQCGTDGFRDIINEMKHDGVWPVFKQEKPFEHKPTASDFENIIKLKPGSNMSTYIEAKQIELINAELDGDTVVIPLYNFSQEVVGHQRIAPNGLKKFNKGLVKDQAFGVIGTLTGDCTAWVTEGYATGVSVHMALDQQVPVIFALDAGTLPKICNAFFVQWPDITLQIAADNDTPGIAAAKASKRQYALPEIQGADWNDIHVGQGLDSVKQGLQRLHDAWVEPNILDELVWINDAQPILRSNYLIKGWLGREQMAVLYGQSNTGKSFLMLDMAYHIAAGRDWHGQRVKQGVTIYLAAEGGNGYLNRARVLQDHYQDENVKLAIRPCPVNLLNPEADLPKLKQLIDAVAEKHGKIELIVVDTLSRALSGGNENGPEDMTAYIANVDALREHAACAVATVHHSGKSTDTARGHSSLRAATDTEIELTYDEDAKMRFAKATKQRDIESGKEFAFELNAVELGVDEDGDPVTSCYVVPVDEERQQDAKVKFTKNENLVVSCFKQLWSEHVGKQNPGGTGWPDGGSRWVIEEDDLRKHFYGKVTATNKSQAYVRAVDGLLQKGELSKNEGFFWLVRQKYKL